MTSGAKVYVLCDPKSWLLQTCENSGTVKGDNTENATDEKVVHNLDDGDAGVSTASVSRINTSSFILDTSIERACLNIHHCLLPFGSLIILLLDVDLYR